MKPEKAIARSPYARPSPRGCNSDMTAVTLDLSPIVKLTDEQFYQLCHANRDLKLERTAKGELIVMSPTGD